jgi:hypothetical protein
MRILGGCNLTQRQFFFTFPCGLCGRHTFCQKCNVLLEMCGVRQPTRRPHATKFRAGWDRRTHVLYTSFRCWQC